MNRLIYFLFFVLAVMGLLGVDSDRQVHFAIIPAIIAGVAAVGGAVAGGLSSAASRAAALRQNEKAVKAWLDVNIPDPETQKLALARFVETGELTPELEEAVKRDGTAFSQINLDPSTRERQLKALDALSMLGDGGLTPEEQAAQTDARIEIDSRDRGRREAIADSFARRGISGSGVELTQQLSGAQAAQEAEARLSRNTMAEARKRALDSIIAGGRLAGDIRAFDYGMAKDRAGAEDAISDFNARMLAGTRQRNVDRTNEARKFDLARRREVADRNTALANDEMKWNQVGRYQQAFDNQKAVAAGRANAYAGNATAMNDASNANANMWANIGGAAGKFGFGIYDRMTKKEDPSYGDDDYLSGEDQW